jgi:hypothetical protein
MIAYKALTGYVVGDRVWDNLLGRYDTIEDISIRIDKKGTQVRYKMENHTQFVNLHEMSKEEGCSCPPRYDDGRSFDGVSYHCPKHGR